MKHIKELRLNEAYVNNEKTKQVRDDLKREFPAFKFSVRKENYSTVDVHIISGPISLTDKKDGYEDVNVYWVKDHYKDEPEKMDFLLKVLEIINKGNHDRSDIMSDYFDVGFYVNLTIGQWDKPYVWSLQGKKIRDLDQKGIDDYLSKHKPIIPTTDNEPESKFKEFHKEKSFEKNNTKNMKHIKEFKLNELYQNGNMGYKSDIISVDKIRETIISELIEYYEFTDVFLDKSDVQERIDELAQNKFNEFIEVLNHMSDDRKDLDVLARQFETELTGEKRWRDEEKTSTYDSRGGVFPR